MSSLIKPNQLKAARVMVGMSQEELGDACKVTGNTISNAEQGKNVGYGTILEMVKALNARGIRFTETGVELTQ
jgi:transcriptional regulator with XRE-family HTH domain